MQFELIQEIVGEPQDQSTNTEQFIARKRALINQLWSAKTLTEQFQIGMIYGQIRFDIRKKNY